MLTEPLYQGVKMRLLLLLLLSISATTASAVVNPASFVGSFRTSDCALFPNERILQIQYKQNIIELRPNNFATSLSAFKIYLNHLTNYQSQHVLMSTWNQFSIKNEVFQLSNSTTPISMTSMARSATGNRVRIKSVSRSTNIECVLYRN